MKYLLKKIYPIYCFCSKFIITPFIFLALIFWMVADIHLDYLYPLRNFLFSYKEYLLKEHPSRSDQFVDLVQAMHAAQVEGVIFTKDDIINILGEPDVIENNVSFRNFIVDLFLYNYNTTGKDALKGQVSIYFFKDMFYSIGYGQQ